MHVWPKHLLLKVRMKRPSRCLTAARKFFLSRFPIDPYYPDLIDSYFAAGETDKAVEMTKGLRDYYYARLDYFLKQKPYIINSAEYEIQSAIQYTSKVAGFCTANDRKDLGEEINKKLEAYYADYISKQKAATTEQAPQN